MRKLTKYLNKTAMLIMVMLLCLNILTMDGRAYMWPVSPGSLNIQTYTLSSSSNVNVYSNSSRTSKIGSIYPGDLITVLRGEGDAAYVRYPISGSKTKEGWVALSTLSTGKLNSSYSLAMRANGNVKMYRRETGSETIGSISTGDIVYLIYAGTRYGDGTGRAQFIYPIGNGSQWKMGWGVYNDIENADFRACGGSAVLADGDYHLYVSPTHRVDGFGGDGTNVHVWETVDVPQQTVRLRHQGNGKYTVEFGHGWYLDQKGGGSDPGTTLWRYPWNGSDAQLWYIADLGNGAYGFFNVGSGLSLDVYCYQTSTNGADILAYKFNGQRVYLNSNNGGDSISDRQRRMVEVAEMYLGNTNYNNLCQQFVRIVAEQAAGVYGTRAGDAVAARKMWLIDSSMDNIPVGAAVYLQGSSPYGHVGIYVGNGYVIHARETVRKDSLSDLCPSKYKYMGWGWQCGVDLR